MSRVISSLGPGEAMFKAEVRPKFRHGISMRESYKRKLLALPPSERHKACCRVAIKRESKGRKAEMRRYNESAAAFFSEPGNDVCLICVKLREDGEDILLRPATERHHVRGRIGRLLNWRPGQIPCCRGHRLWPHENPARARKLGLPCEPSQWNTYPPERSDRVPK